MTDLQALPVEELKHVGLQSAAILRAKRILTVGDLLSRLPRRYIDLRTANDWNLVAEKVIGATVAVVGTVTDQRSIGSPKNHGMSVTVQSPSGHALLRLVYFRAPPGLKAKLPLGASVRVIGILRDGSGSLEVHQPRVLAPTAKYNPIEPVYSSIGSISPLSVGKLIDSALTRLKAWTETVPPHIGKTFAVQTAQRALMELHRPTAAISISELVSLQRATSNARQRLAFEELLTMMITIERARLDQGVVSEIALDSERPVIDAINERLGIVSTEAQRGAVSDILLSMSRPTPMRKLLVGDVGSGKTAVAAAASLAAIRAGKSVLWLAPTTIVAEQHAQTLTRAVKSEGGPIAVLLGSTVKRASLPAARPTPGSGIGSGSARSQTRSAPI